MLEADEVLLVLDKELEGELVELILLNELTLLDDWLLAELVNDDELSLDVELLDRDEAELVEDEDVLDPDD